MRDFDVVLDLAGGQTPLRVMPTLRDGGLLIAVTLRWDLASDAADDRVRVTYMLVEPDRAGLEAIAEPADSGRPRARRPDRSAAQTARAHELGETGQSQGKLDLAID